MLPWEELDGSQTLIGKGRQTFPNICRGKPVYASTDGISDQIERTAICDLPYKNSSHLSSVMLASQQSGCSCQMLGPRSLQDDSRGRVSEKSRRIVSCIDARNANQRRASAGVRLGSPCWTGGHTFGCKSRALNKTRV